MRKNCPFCGAEMPEEANLCLTCFAMCFTQSEAHAKPLRLFGKSAFRPKVRRRTERWVSAVLTLFLLSGVLLTAFSSLEKVSEAPQTPNTYEQIAGTSTNAGENTNTVSNLSTGAATDGEAAVGEPVRLSGMAEGVFGKVTGPGTPAGTTSLGGFGTVGTQTQPVLGIRPGTGATTGNTQSNAGNSTSGNTAGESNAATEPEETEPTEPEYDSFAYRPYDSKKNTIALIKYNGNSSKVVVPAVIDGHPVANVDENTFYNNSKITEITFESSSAQTSLTLDAGCMTNLPSLKVVRMPDTDLGIFPGFAKNCLRLEKIEVDNNQYRFENGALYCWNSREWEIYFYAPACKNTTLTVPTWCAGIDCRLDENPYLKRVEFHKAATNFINNYSVGDALEYVYVEPGNPKAFSVDGVLFTKDNTGKYTFSLYPPSKKDKTFVMPENVELDMFNYYCPYLEELWIPASSRVDSTNALFYRQCFTNLKVIHLQKGHPYEAECKSTFAGKTEMY